LAVDPPHHQVTGGRQLRRFASPSAIENEKTIMDDELTIHQGQPVRRAGMPLERARAAVILLHGRGASAADLLPLVDALDAPEVGYLAPEASGGTWYPNSFLAPLHTNEPNLSSALLVVADLLADLEDHGIPAGRVMLLGFSQGACLSSEFVARRPRRYGGLVALSGGLIGSSDRSEVTPPDDKSFDYTGSLDGTPVLLGCSDIDPHIPVERVRRSAKVLQALGGDVTVRIYPGMGHTINTDELRIARDMLRHLCSDQDRVTDA
jgi:phospholipase/carboxylesterase